jgi:cytochrome c-type biogenesis protein CcmE
MRLNGGQITGVFIIICALGMIAYQATRSESTVTFYTPAEVFANLDRFEGKLFRVSGLVLKGTQNWDPHKSELKFRISDLEGHEFDVHYHGIPPDLFKEGQGVIVEGRLISKIHSEQNTQQTILAHLLMVKHSEVYDTKTDHTKIKEVKLLESILKNQKGKLSQSSFDLKTSL